MIVKELNVRCIWDGTLAGVLLKNDTLKLSSRGKTTKIIGMHGWLDNLNSLIPLAKQLVDRNSNYEVYLYDRAGHGFSSHLPRGIDYAAVRDIQDLRTVIQTLGWDKEKFSIIGHSQGGIYGMLYAASYPDEVSCLVTIDALPRRDVSPEKFFTVHGSRIDTSLNFYNRPARTFDTDLTFEKALELTKTARPGITDDAVRLLLERLVRRDTTNDKLHFTRDESLKLQSLFPFINAVVRNILQSVKAPLLFIGATNPQWPRPHESIDLLKQYHPHFEMTFIDGPHHLHMTHVNEVVERIEQHFNKYLHHSFISMIENSKL